MIRSKIFNFVAYTYEGHVDLHEKFEKHKDAHDKEISDFIELLSNEGHTFVNMNSVAYGRFEPTNRVRTIIIYIENPTRKVCFEKIKNK
jgi:hypothetical protein